MKNRKSQNHWNLTVKIEAEAISGTGTVTH